MSEQLEDAIDTMEARVSHHVPELSLKPTKADGNMLGRIGKSRMRPQRETREAHDSKRADLLDDTCCVRLGVSAHRLRRRGRPPLCSRSQPSCGSHRSHIVRCVSG